MCDVILAESMQNWQAISVHTQRCLASRSDALSETRPLVSVTIFFIQATWVKFWGICWNLSKSNDNCMRDLWLGILHLTWRSDLEIQLVSWEVWQRVSDLTRTRPLGNICFLPSSGMFPLFNEDRLDGHDDPQLSKNLVNLSFFTVFLQFSYGPHVKIYCTLYIVFCCSTLYCVGSR